MRIATLDIVTLKLDWTLVNSGNVFRNRPRQRSLVKIEFNSCQYINMEIIYYYFISPWRILEDAGGAFAMGGIGGSLWHGIKGFKNSPRVS